MEYVLAKIIGERQVWVTEGRRKVQQHQYRCKWDHYEGEDTWESAANVAGTTALQEYKARLGEQDSEEASDSGSESE